MQRTTSNEHPEFKLGNSFTMTRPLPRPSPPLLAPRPPPPGPSRSSSSNNDPSARQCFGSVWLHPSIKPLLPPDAPEVGRLFPIRLPCSAACQLRPGGLLVKPS